MTSTLSRLLLVLLALSSLTLARTSGTFAAVAPSPEALMQQGAQAYQRGAFEQALAAWKEAARLYERDGKSGDQIEALTLSARGAQALGQTAQALLQLDLALVLSQKHGDPLVTAGVQAHLGRTYLAARQLDEAAARLNEALALARRHHSPSLAAATLNDLGVLQALRPAREERWTTAHD